MLIASVPFSFCSSTVRINLVLETSVIAFLMYLFSAAVWKYLDAVILLIYFIQVFPFPPCDDLERNAQILIDFSLTVKAATLIFISEHGSAFSSAREGKSGFLYYLVKS